MCVRTCPQQGLHLAARPERVITPVNSVHRIVMMAIERGNLQDLIFEAIASCPEGQHVQVKSRYLETLITWGERHILQ